MQQKEHCIPSVDKSSQPVETFTPVCMSREFLNTDSPWIWTAEKKIVCNFIFKDKNEKKRVKSEGFYSFSCATGWFSFAFCKLNKNIPVLVLCTYFFKGESLHQTVHRDSNTRMFRQGLSLAFASLMLCYDLVEIYLKWEYKPFRTWSVSLVVVTQS